MIEDVHDIREGKHGNDAGDSDHVHGKTDVEQMHRQLQTWIPVDEIRVCYHTDEDGCDCRKPLPGVSDRGDHERGAGIRCPQFPEKRRLGLR